MLTYLLVQLLSAGVVWIDNSSTTLFNLTEKSI
nr:MAG TPA: hypothetical protein [Crassvirales sp.]